MRDLAALTPGSLNRIHPCNSGAEAVEGALKAARFFTGRTQIVAARRGFHGRTFGAMTATWNKQYSGPFKPLVPDFSHIPYNDIQAVTAAITEDTAAVLVEVIQGEGGVHPGDPAYFEALRHHCNQTGTLLIFDEVQTGFGRTGKMFATEHLSILPDVMTLGKSLGGGLPMGAVVWREELGKLDALTHGSTFGGNPLACAASRAMMQVLQDEALPARAAELGAWFMAELNALNARRVREVRGRGLMIGLELRTRVTPVLKALSDAGVWAIPAGSMVLRLLPPLIIPRSDLERVLEVLGEVL
jgi:acetylornithine/LysW-gamma-L-lysine aminotransferase